MTAMTRDGITVAVASGKGGTGKTTVAVSLALSLAGGGVEVSLLDCDVEEPNCHIFLRPQIESVETVGIPIPSVDMSRCVSCGECGRVCEYHAIVSLKSGPLVFPELCHGCGGCAKACLAGAITEVEERIGVVEIGNGGGIRFVKGCLDVGRAMSPPLIRAVKRHVRQGGVTVIDCPPGTSCPVIAAVRGSDFVLLVTEPTPFGLNDLALAVETVRTLGIPFAVVVNRSDSGDARVVDYCHAEGIGVFLEIPDDRRVAEAYSRGQAMLVALPELKDGFGKLMGQVRESVERRRG